MKEWFTPSEIAALALPETPATIRGVNIVAQREDWKHKINAAGKGLARKRSGRGGGWEYHYSVLPSMAQTRLVRDHKRANPDPKNNPKDQAPASEVWSFFERLPDRTKAKAQERLGVLEAVEALRLGGLPKDQAVFEVSRQRGVGTSTIYNWFKLVDGNARSDWLAYLAPRHAGRSAQVECDPRAWEALKADYLRDAQPSFSTCYDRLKLIAEANGWPIPSARTLERRLEREIPKPVMVLQREGSEALMRMLPPQERDRTGFHALQAVNVDGHKWDVFVKWPDGTIDRPMMAAIQDLYSNKCLAWRVDRSENSDLIRLTFADVFREFGIPEMAWLDNGRGFAAKCISGGTPNRYRFKVKADEPSGILTTLGINIHWTRPYSGQSKPIERMFRDLCDSIAKHPAFQGAYTGNKPEAKPESYASRAIPLADFLAVVEQGIRMHNAKPNRNTRVCDRVKSFDQAFDESYAEALIRKAAPEALRMCLLAAESVRADRESGAVRLLNNRYWAEFLQEHRGEKLTLRFDPEDLHSGVHVHRLDGAFVGYAECIEAVGFADTQAARKRARAASTFRRATREAAEAELQLSTADMAALLPEFDEPETIATKTIRLVNGGAALAALTPAAQTVANEDADEEFSRSFRAGLKIVEGGRDG